MPSDIFGTQTAFDPFTDNAETSFRRGARDAARFPPELQEMMNMMLEVLRGRVSGGNVTPFVKAPKAPDLQITPLEQQLTDMGGRLASSVGVQPIEDAFRTAQGLAGQSLNLGEISDEVTPMLSPRIQQMLDQERQGRLQIGEELTSQGASLGTPLVQAQANLQQGTNRDISAEIINAIMGERALRGGEVTAGGDQLLRTGAAAPILAERFASLPRDISMQQFGVRSQAAGQRSDMIQQVLDFLMGGAGVGTQQFGTTARTLLGGEELAQRQRQAELEFLGSLMSSAGSMAGCWIAGALYGWYTEDFYKAREWIFERWQGRVADATRWLYLQYGMQVAGLVKRSPVARAIVKPWFDMAIRKCEEARRVEAGV